MREIYKKKDKIKGNKKKSVEFEGIVLFDIVK